MKRVSYTAELKAEAVKQVIEGATTWWKVAIGWGCRIKARTFG